MFPERLKEVRLSKNLSQSSVAKMSGLNLRQYQRYELGEQNITLAKLVPIADALEVSIDYLAGRTDDPTFTSTKHQ